MPFKYDTDIIGAAYFLGGGTAKFKLQIEGRTRMAVGSTSVEYNYNSGRYSF